MIPASIGWTIHVLKLVLPEFFGRASSRPILKFRKNFAALLA